MAEVDSAYTEDDTKANSLRKKLNAAEAKYEANPNGQFERLAVEMEKRFEKLCYQIVKINSKLNGSSISVEQLQSMSVYSFYVLKANLMSDKGK